MIDCSCFKEKVQYLQRSSMSQFITIQLWLYVPPSERNISKENLSIPSWCFHFTGDHVPALPTSYKIFNAFNTIQTNVALRLLTLSSSHP